MNAVQRATRKATCGSLAAFLEPEVVGIARLAGGLSDSVFPWHAATNRIQHVQSLLTGSRLGEPANAARTKPPFPGQSLRRDRRSASPDRFECRSRAHVPRLRRERGGVHAVQQPRRRDPFVVENRLALCATVASASAVPCPEARTGSSEGIGSPVHSGLCCWVPWGVRQTSLDADMSPGESRRPAPPPPLREN